MNGVSEKNGGWIAGGLAGWLLARLRGAGRREPRLSLIERITIAPRQSLALIEAEGRRFLVSASGDGAATFFPLDGRGLSELGARRTGRRNARGPKRLSW